MGAVRAQGVASSPEPLAAGQTSPLVCSNKVRLEVMPDGNLAMEIGNLEAVVILPPAHAYRIATRIRTLLAGDEDSFDDLLAERMRINQAIAFKRKQQASREFRSVASLR